MDTCSEIIDQIIAEQREYAARDLIGRWRWRHEHWGPPVGWRTMTWKAKRRLRQEGRTAGGPKKAKTVL